MATVIYKVYGADGHRQKASFSPSVRYDWSEDGNARIIGVMNADRTGTNDYSVIKITRNTLAECDAEFEGQLSDGIYENCRTGAVEKVENYRMIVSVYGWQDGSGFDWSNCVIDKTVNIVNVEDADPCNWWAEYSGGTKSPNCDDAKIIVSLYDEKNPEPFTLYTAEVWESEIL